MQHLLVLSEDEQFWEDLSAAAPRVGQRLLRHQAGGYLPDLLRILSPAAVLLDLDGAAPQTWDAADIVLQETGGPLLFLVTTRSGSEDFKSAIEAGALISKHMQGKDLLLMIKDQLDSGELSRRHRNAAQKLIVRWLRPYDCSTNFPQPCRFWGINE
jgi:hypothetical protein